MPAHIRDYFLPAYVRNALERANQFRLVTHHPFGDELVIESLQVTPESLDCMARALRQRRAELLENVDLRDRQAAAARFAVLASLAEALRQPAMPLRRETCAIAAHISGFSPQMVDVLLQSFVDLLAYTQADSIEVTLPPNQAAQRFVRTAHGYARYYGGALSLKNFLAMLPGYAEAPILPLPWMGMPTLISHVAAGNVPGISLMQVLLGAMVGAANLEKNASAEPFFGPRFLEMMAELEGQQSLFPLSDLIALVTFPGEAFYALTELIHQGDHLQATGGIDSERAISRMVQRLRSRSLRDFKRRVSGHWHKVSFDVVANQFLTPEWMETVAYNTAFDNSMFNTQGCLSAQQIFIEGTPAQAHDFIERYRAAMQQILSQLPKGSEPQSRLREMYQWYENKPGFRILTSLREIEQSPFVIIYDDAPQHFAIHNALNRSVIIRRLDRLESDLPRLIGSGARRPLLQSCGVALPGKRLLPVAEILGQAGVNRIVPVGDIWNMRLDYESWDGYLAPTDLIAPQTGQWTTISFHEIEKALRGVEARNRSLGGASASE
jgi:hypothetical protein